MGCCLPRCVCRERGEGLPHPLPPPLHSRKDDVRLLAIEPPPHPASPHPLTRPRPVAPPPLQSTGQGRLLAVELPDEEELGHPYVKHALEVCRWGRGEGSGCVGGGGEGGLVVGFVRGRILIHQPDLPHEPPPTHPACI